MNLDWINEELDSLRARGLYRTLRTTDSPTGRTALIDGRERLLFCSNNYLGLANHPAVRSAARDALDRWGFGAGASRLISGHTAAHQDLENRLADWLQKPAALTFSSGFAANSALIATLAGPGDLVALDQRAHASLIDGARASGAAVRTWPHATTEKLARLLDRGRYRRALIVTESLFSMDGDTIDLHHLIDLKDRYHATLILDEAHALACLGPDGQGLAAHAGLLDRVDCYVGTLSKAIGGVGGFVAGPAPLIELLINRARPFIFSTALPPAACEAAHAALELALAQPDRRQRLAENAHYLRRRLTDLGYNPAPACHHILPVLLGPAQLALELAARLWDEAIWAPAVRPPTVPPGAARLRLSVTSEHTTEDLDRLTEALARHLPHAP